MKRFYLWGGGGESGINTANCLNLTFCNTVEDTLDQGLGLKRKCYLNFREKQKLSEISRNFASQKFISINEVKFREKFL
jgi:hypothetical protein